LPLALRPTPYKRTLFYLAADTVAVVAATLLLRIVLSSFTLYTSSFVLHPPSFDLLSFGMVALMCQFTVNSLFGVYRLKWSTYSLSDLPRSCGSILVVGVLLTFLASARAFGGLPAVLIPVWTVTNLFGSLALRGSKRFWLEVLAARRGRRALLVVCSEKSYFLLDALRRIPHSGYRFVGFIDPAPVNRGLLSQGLPVLGTMSDIETIVRRHRIQTVFVFLSTNGLPTAVRRRASVIPDPADDGTRTTDDGSIGEFYERLQGLGVEVKTIPSLTDLITDRADLEALDRLTIHELTGRPPVRDEGRGTKHEGRSMEDVFGRKRIMVTGAGGSIGAELCRQLARFGPAELILFERDDSNLFYIERDLSIAHPGMNLVPFLGDITRDQDVTQAFARYRPDIVFHAAAYKHVPILEFHPDDAIRVNVLGTHLMARAAVKHGTECLIYISTDKAVNPTSVMGTSKRIGEIVVTSMNGLGDVRFIAVRFGNVMDSRGSVTTIFRDAIRKRQALTITHPEMKRYFMLTSEAVLLVLQAATLGRGGEVFVLDMGNPVRVWDLAVTMIRKSGLRPNIDIPLTFTGMRPGEKLFEELLTAEEGTIATGNERIFKARISRQHCYPDVLEQLHSLEQALESSDVGTMHAAMRQVVKNYVPDTNALSIRPTATGRAAGAVHSPFPTLNADPA
jgi:FlaA1/EpsC-like NDP-sugar epimerase